MISFDFSKSLAPQNLFEQYAQQVAETHQKIIAEKKNQEIGWWNLPFDTTLQKKSAELAKQFSKKFETLLVLGIGGSSQGLKTLAAALAPEQEKLFIQEAPDGDSLKVLFKKMNPKKTAVNVISKSGGTIETLALLEACQKIFEYKGCNFKDHLVITTEENDGKLYRRVKEEGLAFLPVPKNVGGRFSVFSPVGLFGLGFLGVDVDELIAGTQTALERGLKEDPEENPIYQNGLLHFHFAQEKNISVMMTYSDLLQHFGGWYAQLWGESLGKDGKGQTPLPLRGPQDQHSLAQLVLDGPKDKMVTFIVKGSTLPLSPSPRGRGLGEGADDIKILKQLGIEPIDLVVVNLYPFETTPSIDNIDIGGPTMLRAAAKNFEAVTAVCDPLDYDRVVAALEKGEVPIAMRKDLAGKVFQLTARYEAAIANYFVPQAESTAHLLRYGENPHQKAVFHVGETKDLLWDEPLQGKELSYNNILDADAAWWLMQEFKNEPFACAIIKHTNPCGVALSKKSLLEAFEKAFACDSLSAFGGIVAFNREVDGKTAEALSKIFLEIILAPAFSKEGRTILEKKKNLRLLAARAGEGPPQLLKSAGGGLLLQDVDRAMEDVLKCQVKTKRKPTAKELEALQFAWKIVKHVKSNAIAFAHDDSLAAVGAGQTSRIDSVKVAMLKAAKDLKGTVVASDAFFPFPDNIEAIAKAGATAIIQPGGSLKDAEIIAAADKQNLAMVFTGIRHFRH